MYGRPVEAVKSFQKTFKFSARSLKFNHTVMARIKDRILFFILICFVFVLYLFLLLK